MYFLGSATWVTFMLAHAAIERKTSTRLDPAYLTKQGQGLGLVGRGLPARIHHPNGHALKPVDRAGIHIHVYVKRGIRGKPGQVAQQSRMRPVHAALARAVSGLTVKTPARLKTLTRNVDADGQCLCILERIEERAVHLLGGVHGPGVSGLLAGLVEGTHEGLTGLVDLLGIAGHTAHWRSHKRQRRQPGIAW